MTKNYLWKNQARTIAALIMVLAVLATIVGLGLNTGVASAASTTNKDFFLVSLTKTNRNCDGSLAGPVMTQRFGSVFIFEQRSFRRSRIVSAQILLRHALPFTAYNVRLIQTPSGFNCSVAEARIFTNRFGNGFAFIREFLRPDTRDAFVAINNQNNFSDFFTTQDVFFHGQCC